MLNNKEIMALARTSLKGHWGRAMGSFLLYFAICIAFSFLGNILNGCFEVFLDERLGDILGGILTTILEVLFLTPAYVGFALFFFKLVYSKDEKIGDVFKPTMDLFRSGRRKIYWRNLRAIILMDTTIVAITLICCIPAMIFGGIFVLCAQAWLPYDSAHSFAIILGTVVGGILSVIAAALFMPTLHVFYYRLATDENIKAVDCLKESYEMTIEHRSQYWFLWMRFLGWICLCVITFGIALLWIEPYLSASFVIYCKELSNTNSEENLSLENENV